MKSKNTSLIYLLVFIILFWFGGSSKAQAFQNALLQSQGHTSSVQIYKKIQKLNFLGSVLYVGAHPDDENTSMISYLSNKVNARVAYLSMTRGDGGQNLLGPELRELLGVIRTQELLAARRIDGGEQFFTRANDFGYSKTPKETFRIWDKRKVLSDVVWVMRKFRPDVIINRFDHRIAGETHGHHTASARLSVKAFGLAGSNEAFPKQLQYLQPWQPKRLYYNDSWWRYGSKEAFAKVDKSNYLAVNVGVYLPLLGWSNTEISALSRSQHKSQGFGVAGSRGNNKTYLEPIKGDLEPDATNLFAGINTTWSRLEGGKAIGDILYRVQKNFNFKNPAESIPAMLEAYQLIKQLDDPYWRTLKTDQIKEIIAACAGLYLEVATSVQFGTLGQQIPVQIEAINRSNANIQLKTVSFEAVEGASFSFQKSLKNNVDLKRKIQIAIPHDLHYTSPYWLRQPHTIGMYRVDNQQLIGLPETPPELVADFYLTVNGVPLKIKRPLIYKTTTPTQGSVKEPFALVPDVSLALQSKTFVFAGHSSRQIKVAVKAYQDNITGTLHLKIPEGWEVSPKQVEVNIEEKSKTNTFTFALTPPKSQAEGKIQPIFVGEGDTLSKQVHVIDYPHIPLQTVLLPAEAKVIRLDIEIGGEKIGYIEGAGDKVPQTLRQIGYEVTMLSPKKISLSQLEQYDAVVLGIRAYDVSKSLVLNQDILFEYVKQGGTLITQYNTTRELKTDKIAPYPLHLSHNRVTNEKSDVAFLKPDHPVLNHPNEITKQDFKDWVQERGLYFPDEWSKKFTPILGMHDRGEEQMKGSLLVAQYGKGYYVYTGLSFFRELPAGVPGAFRLFANILALGNE